MADLKYHAKLNDKEEAIALLNRDYPTCMMLCLKSGEYVITTLEWFEEYCKDNARISLLGF
jgi:hypothetical protein